MQNLNPFSAVNLKHIAQFVLKYPVDTFLSLFAPDFFVYRAAHVYNYFKSCLLGEKDSPSLSDYFTKTNLNTDHSKEGWFTRNYLVPVLEKIGSSLDYLGIRLPKSLKTILIYGHSTPEGEPNWDVIYSGYEPIFLQRVLMITLNKGFHTDHETKTQKFGFFNLVTANQKYISAFFISVKIVAQNYDLIGFNSYSPQVYFDNAARNINKEILKISAKASDQEIANLINIKTNRLHDFCIQKGNCLKEFTKLTFIIADALSGNINGKSVVVANVVFLSSLYFSSKLIFPRFDEFKRHSIDSKQLHHELLNGNMNVTQLINASEHSRQRLLSSDFQLKVEFMIITTVDALNTALFRDRELFRIFSFFYNADVYNEGEYKKQNERAHDEGTKTINFLTANFLRVTEIFVVADVLYEHLFNQIQKISNRSPENINAIIQEESKKQIEDLYKKFLALPPEKQIMLLEILNNVQIKDSQKQPLSLPQDFKFQTCELNFSAPNENLYTEMKEKEFQVANICPAPSLEDLLRDQQDFENASFAETEVSGMSDVNTAALL